MPKFTVVVERKRTIVERATLTVESDKELSALRSAHAILLSSQGEPRVLAGKWAEVPASVLHGEGYWTARPYDFKVGDPAPATA